MDSCLTLCVSSIALLLLLILVVGFLVASIGVTSNELAAFHFKMECLSSSLFLVA